jgi:hypothetical protein
MATDKVAKVGTLSYGIGYVDFCHDVRGIACPSVITFVRSFRRRCAVTGILREQSAFKVRLRALLAGKVLEDLHYWRWRCASPKEVLIVIDNQGANFC